MNQIRNASGSCIGIQREQKLKSQVKRQERKKDAAMMATKNLNRRASSNSMQEQADVLNVKKVEERAEE